MYHHDKKKLRKERAITSLLYPKQIYILQRMPSYWFDRKNVKWLWPKKMLKWKLKIIFSKWNIYNTKIIRDWAKYGLKLWHNWSCHRKTILHRNWSCTTINGHWNDYFARKKRRPNWKNRNWKWRSVNFWGKMESIKKFLFIRHGGWWWANEFVTFQRKRFSDWRDQSLAEEQVTSLSCRKWFFMSRYAGFPRFLSLKFETSTDTNVKFRSKISRSNISSKSWNFD